MFNHKPMMGFERKFKNKENSKECNFLKILKNSENFQERNVKENWK